MHIGGAYFDLRVCPSLFVPPRALNFPASRDVYRRRYDLESPLQGSSISPVIDTLPPRFTRAGTRASGKKGLLFRARAGENNEGPGKNGGFNGAGIAETAEVA